MDDTTMPQRKPKGFAVIKARDPERMTQIASMGGLRASELGHGRRWTVEEAKAAGKKGGQATSKNRAHMAEIGQRGGSVASKRRVRDRPGIISVPASD